MTIARIVKDEPVYSLFGHKLIREGKDQIVATATPEELMDAVRQSGLTYSEEGLQDVCTDMTYGGRYLHPVDGETPEQTMIAYLAVASIQWANQFENTQNLQEQAEKMQPIVMQGAVAIDRSGTAKRLMDVLDEGEKIAAETE